MKYDFARKKGIKRVVALMAVMMVCLAGCGKGNGSREEKDTENGVSQNYNEDGDYITAKQGATVKLGADISVNNTVDPTEQVEEDFKKATANLAFKLIKELSANEKGRNVMISPDSIITALAMTQNGAKGKTLDEMLGLLGGGMTLDEYNKALSGYNSMLTSLSGVKFAAANSIWIRNTSELKVKKDFIQTNKEYFDSDIFISDFGDETVNDINGWVKDNTDGMIEKLIDHIDPEHMMYLINALSFEAAWAEPYEGLQIDEDATFTNSDGKEEKATMLCETLNGLIRLNGGLGFKKNYEDMHYSFVALLPPEGMSVDEYLAGITGEDFLLAWNSRDYEPDLITRLPEFGYDYGVSLKDALEKLGMSVAFGEEADFSGMCDPSLMSLRIADVIHKTHIELDRNGTKAAAVTAVIMAGEAMAEQPPEQIYITLDRPFVYAIVDNTTGLPVFLGTVNSVEK